MTNLYFLPALTSKKQLFASLTLLLCSTLISLTWADTAQKLIPGSEQLNSKKLKAFKTTTKWGSAYITPGEIEGRQTLNIINTVTSTPNLLVDHIVLDRKSMSLIYRFAPYFAVGQDYLAATINGRQLSGSLNPLNGGPAQIIDTQLDTPVFEASVLGLSLASLELHKDQRLSLPILSISASNKQFSTAWVDAIVIDREQIMAANKQAYNCWVVELKWRDVDYQETLWIAQKPPYQIKKTNQFPDGRSSTNNFQTVQLLNK